MEKTAIIIVTYAKTDFQRELLQKSVEAALKYHPNDTIIVLNDNHEESVEDLLPKAPNLRYELTKHPRCGEVNAYVWSCENMHEFKKFAFIHDSVILHNTLPFIFDSDIHYRPLWFANPYFASVGLMLQEIEDVIKDVKIGPTDGVALYQIILERYIYVVFGCMATWDTNFCEFLKTRTNLLEQAHRFNTRDLRCLFERIIYICFAYAHPQLAFRVFPTLAICGDITNHTKPFFNILLDSELANNPYALKVWQGR